MTDQSNASVLLPPMISYTPNLEDVLLRRCFPDLTDGFYVDIGAFHPTYSSVTRWFYDRGWTGINIDPCDVIEDLLRERPRDINLQVAVSDKEGTASFQVHKGNPGTSSFTTEISKLVEEMAGAIVEIEVVVRTLDSILEEHAPDKKINFLKIDAEGEENAIITATDWKKHRPEVLVVESTDPYTNTRREEAWQRLLAESDYHLAYFDGVNDFWIREESRELESAFQVPVNVLDFYTPFNPELDNLRLQVKLLKEGLDATTMAYEGLKTERENQPTACSMMKESFLRRLRRRLFSSS